MLRHNLTATRFGQMAVQDGNFVPRLKEGRRPHQATIARVRTFLALLDGSKLPVRRAAVENAIEALVGLLDAFDPDPDFEETGLEDDFCDHRGKAMTDGPGCPIADTDHCLAGDDTGTRIGGGCDGGAGDPADAEDDDPLELNGDEGDYSEGD